MGTHEVEPSNNVVKVYDVINCLWRTWRYLEGCDDRERNEMGRERVKVAEEVGRKIARQPERKKQRDRRTSSQLKQKYTNSPNSSEITAGR